MPTNGFQNVFLHFLNYDTQQIFGLKHRYEDSFLFQNLLRSVIVAALLAKEYTFLPIGFGFESTISRRVLAHLACFREDGLIRYAFWETDLSTFISKKVEGYRPYRDLPQYQSFFSTKPDLIYKRVSAPFLNRRTRIGKFCVNKWESASVNPEDPDWQPIYSSFSSDKSLKTFQELMAKFPDIYSTSPFIWPSVASKLDKYDPTLVQKVRLIFEKYYYQGYLDEFDGTVLFDLPFENSTFGLNVGPMHCNSYRKYLNFLYSLGLKPYLDYALKDPAQIIPLRYNPHMILLKEQVYGILAAAESEFSFEQIIAKAITTSPAKEYCHALKADLLSLSAGTNHKLITIPSLTSTARKSDAKYTTNMENGEMIGNKDKFKQQGGMSESLKKSFLAHEYQHGKIGLFSAVLCILGGVVLGLAGIVGHTSWTAKALGFESQITDAGPGVVLFIVGLFLTFFTRPRPRLKDLN